MIANGRLCNDLDGNFTFLSVRGSSVTDYLILNKFDINLLHDFKTLEFSNFSDHAPIYFTFLIKDIIDKPTKIIRLTIFNRKLSLTKKN